MLIRSFFGWNWDTWNTPTDSKPWFIEETLINTWDTQPDQSSTWNSTWEINNEQPEIPTIQEYSEIKIIMPKYLYNSGREALEEDLQEDEKLKINYVLIDDLNSYRNILSDPNFSEADLFLFPYDWKDIIKVRTFSFGDNPAFDKLAFDELIQPIIKDSQIWFLPFAADPMIMYSSIDLEQDNLSKVSDNFSKISDSIYEREPERQLAFPIFFWIADEDYENKWFSREYQDIVRYALIHYFKKYQDANSLWNWINSNILGNIEGFKNYNVWNLNVLTNTITQSECKYFPSICFQVYKFVGIRFWFLSDKDIIYNYFPNKINYFENLSRMAMPFSSIEAPVRIRWRWIPINLQDKKATNNIYKFFVQYLNNHNKYNLRNSTLSVFKKEWNPLIDNKYIWLRWYILETWWNYIDSLRSIRPFRQLIEYQISPEDFLKKTLK